MKTRITIHRSRRKVPKIVRIILSYTFVVGLFIYVTDYDNEDIEATENKNLLKRGNPCGK